MTTMCFQAIMVEKCKIGRFLLDKIEKTEYTYVEIGKIGGKYGGQPVYSLYQHVGKSRLSSA